jgi:RNA polymerase sigma factor (TIGR02999 family)
VSAAASSDVTTLLARLRAGDDSAAGDLLAAVYDELRGLASHMFRDQPADHTLQPTALVNEACLRLLRSANEGWNDRKHLLRAAAQAMRQLLTDHARARKALRRGGGAAKVSLDSSVVNAAAADRGASELDLIALDEALTKLAQMDERLGRVFELRFLVGLSVKETADLLEVSPRTVELDTQLVRGWLQRELAGE